jgi:hypothetical protein
MDTAGNGYGMAAAEGLLIELPGVAEFIANRRCDVLVITIR